MPLGSLGVSPRRALAARFASLLLAAVAAVPATPACAQPPAPPVPPPPENAIPILITVDDLPIASGAIHRDHADRAAITRGLLDVLRKHGIRAVGLVTWGNVLSDADRDLLKLWLDEGHELGNHSLGHLNYTATDTPKYIEDVEAARVQIDALLAEHPGPQERVRFFRFPFLREGDTPQKLDAMREYLASTGQRNLPVTIDDQDWSFEKPWVEAGRRGDPNAIGEVADEYHESLHLEVRHHEAVSTQLFKRTPPQILLLHANQVGAAQWDALFAWLSETGHRFASAEEVLADSAYAERHEYVGVYGPSLWDRLIDRNRRRDARASVEKLLAEQAAAWSRGDIDAFCSAYAEDATFVTPDGVRHGRQTILDRYKTRYADAAAMGSLSLEILEARPIAGVEVTQLGGATPGRVHGMSVAARWTLSYPDKEAKSGSTLIVLERAARGWQIVHDASM